MAENKMRHALISKFEHYCKINDIQKPMINRVNEKWTADELLDSFSVEELHQSMEYYFKINRSPTWFGYSRNVDRLIQSMRLQEEDRKFREDMRKKAQEWLT